MTHKVDGMGDTPFTIKKACDVLCASASGEVLAGLVKKFKPDANADVNATTALFVFAKKAIVCGKTSHTITGACFRDSCIMLKADRTPLDLVKAKLVFATVFAQNAKKAAIDSDAEMKQEEEQREAADESEEEEIEGGAAEEEEVLERCVKKTKIKKCF